MSGDPRERLGEPERRALLAAAIELADRCREAIAAVVGDGITVDVKADASLVTSADLAAERAFRAAVAERYPDHGVLGEEQGLDRPDARFRWVVDPIDGTAEFAHGMPTYGTIIGLFLEGKPLAGVIDHPALGLRVTGAYGLGAWRNGEPLRLAGEARSPRWPRIGVPSRAGFIRRGNDGAVFDAITRAYPECRTFHTCYSHAAALTGALDAAVEWDVPPWDIGALEVLAREAGAWYRLVRERVHPTAGTLLSVVLGRPAVAEPLAELVERAAAGNGA